MDGPHEHLITHRARALAGLGPAHRRPSLPPTAGLDYLAGRTAGDLVAAQAEAVPQALGRPAGPCAPSISPALTSERSGR